MPCLDAEALETDPFGCAFLASLLLEARSTAGRGLRPHARRSPAARLAALFRAAGRTQAQRRIEDALASNPVADLSVIAQRSKLSCRKAGALLRRLELDGVVLLHTTRTGVTVVRLVAPEESRPRLTDVSADGPGASQSPVVAPPPERHDLEAVRS